MAIHIGSGKSVMDWYRLHLDRFVIDPGPKPWWFGRSFAEKPAKGSFFFGSEIINDTRYLSFQSQLSLVTEGWTSPSVAEVVDLLMSGSNLLTGEWTRTRSLIKKGPDWFVICVGQTRHGLIDIYDYYAERKASGRVGIFPIKRQRY